MLLATCYLLLAACYLLLATYYLLSSPGVFGRRTTAPSSTSRHCTCALTCTSAARLRLLASSPTACTRASPGQQGQRCPPRLGPSARQGGQRCLPQQPHCWRLPPHASSLQPYAPRLRSGSCRTCCCSCSRRASPNYCSPRQHLLLELLLLLRRVILELLLLGHVLLELLLVHLQHLQMQYPLVARSRTRGRRRRSRRARQSTTCTGGVPVRQL